MNKGNNNDLVSFIIKDTRVTLVNGEMVDQMEGKNYPPDE